MIFLTSVNRMPFVPPMKTRILWFIKYWSIPNVRLRNNLNLLLTLPAINTNMISVRTQNFDRIKTFLLGISISVSSVIQWIEDLDKNNLSSEKWVRISKEGIENLVRGLCIRIKEWVRVHYSEDGMWIFRDRIIVMQRR